MKKDNRGFTLVELLATIVVLALVLSITGYVAVDAIKKSKEKSYDVTIANIEGNASNYVGENKLSYISKNNGTEYQCITVKDLIDKGFLKNNVIGKSLVAENVTVQKEHYVYIERNQNTKTVTKVVYVKPGVSYYTDCSGNALYDIKITSIPGVNDWAKSKNVKIEYIATDLAEYEYNYSYTGNYENKTTTASNLKELDVTSDGRLTANILYNGVSYLEKEVYISNVDNVGPVIEPKYSGVNPVKDDAVTIPLKVSDAGIGLDESSFTASDITIKIGSNTVNSSNYSLTNKGSGIYDLRIENPGYTGKVIITIPSGKILDKLANGNNDIQIESITFANSYMIVYDCNGGINGPADKEITTGETYTINSTGCTYTGHQFKGWYDSSDSKWSGSIVWNRTESLTLHAKWETNKVNIRYNANGGSMASSHGAGYSLDADGFVLISGNMLVDTIEYGEKLGTAGLYNWNNASYLNLTKGGVWTARKGHEWNMNANGSGTSFDQNTVYSASDFCSNIENENCDVTLYVDWLEKPLRIYYHVNGGTINSNFTTKNSWVAKKNGDTKFCTATGTGYQDGYGYTDSDGYCYEAGYDTPKIDLWNYNGGSTWMNITKGNSSAVAGSEWNTKTNGTGTSFNQSAKYEYSDLIRYAADKDTYYSLSLYVNWADTSVATGACCFCYRNDVCGDDSQYKKSTGTCPPGYYATYADNC